MPCASKCDTISADETNVYREGIIGNHLAVVGIERIMIPHQVSSEIALVLRLSTAALRVRRSLIWSCILVLRLQPFHLANHFIWFIPYTFTFMYRLSRLKSGIQ